ncbi:MAG: hypothetical protein IKT54_05615 [Clostridia bacterium]|jgi:hypothetical protein|nr:hypothetical protein [Clostridia bacterium]
MLKGCQKKIIMLKNTGSEIFDEAYFILSDSAIASRCSQSDMIAEANRIVEMGYRDTFLQKKTVSGKARFQQVLFFFIGALFAAGVCALIAVL